DNQTISGDFRKLGNYSVGKVYKFKKLILEVVNCYTQYRYGRDEGVVYLDYEALALCMRKINHAWAGKRLGVPLIGCGLAGGDWDIVKEIYKRELTNLDTTVVHFRT
ncbi:MAG: phosphatase, partial [Candidatus Heimdallarchaeota archaeon]